MAVRREDATRKQPARQRDNTDGRVARGQRTREAIIEAHSALLREGNLKPTAQMVAERAGVSVRTLWLNFKDLEALLNASTSFWLANDDRLWQPIDTSLALPARIDNFCAQRARRLESIGPAARAAALAEPFSPALQASRRKHVRRVREDVEATFAPELPAGRPDREELVYGVAIAASWPSWQLLRDDFGLGVAEATGVMHNTIRELLGL